MTRAVDETGNVYGALTVRACAGTVARGAGKRVAWLCACECGLGRLRVPRAERTIRNQVDVVTHISGALKDVAAELGVPLVALAQLSRESARINRDTTDPEKVMRPTLTDLRDSGALEQDADVVAFLHRPAYYTKNPHDHAAEVIVAKNRDGETGTARLSWMADVQAFDEIASSV